MRAFTTERASTWRDLALYSPINMHERAFHDVLVGCNARQVADGPDSLSAALSRSAQASNTARLGRDGGAG